jgi:hypothetical protein
MGRRAAALRGRAAAAALTSTLQCAKVSKQPISRLFYCWKVVYWCSRTVPVDQRGADFRLPSTGPFCFACSFLSFFARLAQGKPYKQEEPRSMKPGFLR